VCFSPPVIILPASEQPFIANPVFSYPPAGPWSPPFRISADGDFCCWGSPGTVSISNIDVKCVDQYNNVLGTQPVKKTGIAADLNKDFGFALAQYPSMTFYLAILVNNVIVTAAGQYGPYTTGAGG
jgi:hypothetical protein